MTPEEIEQAAIVFARKNKKAIAREYTDVKVFPPDTQPVSVFMAGSPGAGKTESAKNLIKRFTINGSSILRIDSDDIRPRMPGYDGKNSYLFQGATSIVADCIQDLALDNDQSYIFDGTLSNLSRARGNIQRSISHAREVFIVYVYQDPLQAWAFVKAREKNDGRFIPTVAFIEQYFQARENVNTLKHEFRNQLTVELIVKNIDGTDYSYQSNVTLIDNHIPEKYTRKQLEELIN